VTSVTQAWAGSVPLHRYAPGVAAAKVRLDQLLAQRGLFPSRSRAAASVMAGEVRVGEELAEKPGRLVAADARVSVASGRRFVSRGGIKLENALQQLAVPVEGRRCLDVGASTGGFTDCLLKGGAAEVTCVDVAYGELAWELRTDERVTVLERTNARALAPGDLPYRPDLIVADVSFISLLKVLPAVLRCAAERFDCLAMVKPQFEVGRDKIGKNGVVRDLADRRAAIVTVAQGAPAAVMGFAPSGLPGPKGNHETFVWLAETGRAGAVGDVAGAVAEVDA
jgi:23S rRNA (cytidine1920-2'-O)/16S rRNA (cytidine1409-2'-O)-methyltransferase